MVDARDRLAAGRRCYRHPFAMVLSNSQGSGLGTPSLCCTLLPKQNPRFPFDLLVFTRWSSFLPDLSACMSNRALRWCGRFKNRIDTFTLYLDYLLTKHDRLALLRIALPD